VPYAIAFRKAIAIADLGQYINDCCVGGDRVLDQLLPSLRQRYHDVEANQVDWGWFAWFEKSGVKLAVDVFANNPVTGEFLVHLTSRKPRLLLGARIEDTPELEELRNTIVNDLESWSVDELMVERVNEKYMPIRGAF
jgi:hypothetical protein